MSDRCPDLETCNAIEESLAAHETMLLEAEGRAERAEEALAESRAAMQDTMLASEAFPNSGAVYATVEPLRVFLATHDAVPVVVAPEEANR